ncbi:MAG: phosphoglycolate phosphatase [Rhodothermales bacterium]|jgi:phosphoglycolate phosphatase
MSVLLFDIDGTLLLAPSLGRRHFEAALTSLCGRHVSAEGVSFAGRTDKSLAREMLARAGYADGIEQAMSEVLDAYATLIEDGIDPADVRILPGVRVLLEALSSHENLHLGVLTGNLERTGQAKLAAARLDVFFGFGAYGSDHEDRNQLPVFARDRAQVAIGRDVPFETLIVLGDTEHDIACGRAVGARTVAVCTGLVDRDSLLNAQPDLLLDDFREPAALLAFLGT